MSNTADVPADGSWLTYPGRGVVGVAGDTLPADGEVGYAHGCLFQLVNGADYTDAIYINVGDETSADFNALEPTGQDITLVADSVTESTAGEGVTIDGSTGDLRLLPNSGAIFSKQGSATDGGSDFTLTPAILFNGLVDCNGETAAVAATLATGAVMDAAIPSNVGTLEAFNWSLVNRNTSSGAVTVTDSAGFTHTVYGNAVVAVATSATFRAVRVVSGVWVSYRIA